MSTKITLTVAFDVLLVILALVATAPIVSSDAFAGREHHKDNDHKDKHHRHKHHHRHYLNGDSSSSDSSSGSDSSSSSSESGSSSESSNVSPISIISTRESDLDLMLSQV